MDANLPELPHAKTFIKRKKLKTGVRDGGRGCFLQRVTRETGTQPQKLLRISLWNNLIFKFSSTILRVLESWSWNLEAGGGKHQKGRTKQAQGTEWWQQDVNLVTRSVKARMVITRIFATCSEYKTLKKRAKRCVYDQRKKINLALEYIRGDINRQESITVVVLLYMTFLNWKTMSFF